jgi:uncharacterized protein (DUF952 family)
MILHLVRATTWRTCREEATYAPDGYETEGFVHCSPDDEVMLVVANRYYADADDEVLVLGLDELRLTSDVRWEAPSPPGRDRDDSEGASPEHPLAAVRFPHVYGPLDVPAVVEVRRLVRDDGRYVGYEPWDG